jgi:predicted DNA-binding transcriptional regulator
MGKNEVAVMNYLIENPGATEERIETELKMEAIDVTVAISNLFKDGRIKEAIE